MSNQKPLVSIRNSFIAGVAVVLPVILTVIIIKFLVSILNNIAIAPLINLTEHYLEGSIPARSIAQLFIFIIIVIFLIIVGAIARIVFIRRWFSFIDRVVRRLPMAGKIYTTVKELSYAFLGQGKRLFQRAVFIEYPRKGLYTIGFITTESADKISTRVGKKLFNVFVPTAPNPTSGIFLLVPKEEIIESGLSVEEALKMVISSGAVMPHGKL